MNKAREIFNRLKNTKNRKVLIGVVCSVLLINILLVLFVFRGNNKSESSNNDVSNEKTFYVNGNSMAPNIDDGTILKYEKRKDVARYDVIVYKADESNSLIKRVYGLPNEKITINEGQIFINDELIEDEYAFGNITGFYEVTLGEDEYYVLGDYRSISLDSRHTGPIKASAIEGIVIK